MKKLHQTIFGSFIHKITDPIIIIDSTGNIIDANSIANSELNLSEKKMIGQNFFTALCKNAETCTRCPLKDESNKVCKLGGLGKTYQIRSTLLKIVNQDAVLLVLKPFNNQYDKNSVRSEIQEGYTIGMVVTRPDGIISFADEQFFRLSCLLNRDVIGKKITSIFPNEKEHIENMLQGEMHDIENQNIRVKCQQTGNLFLQASILSFPDDENKYFWFFHRLGNQESNSGDIDYGQIFQKSPIGVVFCEVIFNDKGRGIDFKLLSINESFWQLFEITENNLTGKTAKELFPDFADEVYEKFGIVAFGGDPYFFIYLQESRRKYFEVVAYRVAENKIALLFNDASQKIKSRNELESIFNLSIDLMCIADLDGNLVKTNPSFQSVLGLSEARLKEKRIQDFIFSSDTELEVEALLMGRQDEDTVVHYQNSYKDKNGEEIWLSWTFQTLSKEKTIFAIGRDITPIKNTEQEFIAAKESAEEGDRLKSAFLANMSHEVRTPMNAIIGFSTLLDNDELEKDKRKKYIQIIKGRCNDLLRIIDDILDISRIEAGQVDIFPEPFYISDFFNEIMTIHQFRLEFLEKTHLTIEIVPLTENFQIYNDRQRLLQVMNNLLDNAIKFTSEGKITFGCKKYDDTKLLFYVEDTGIGISKDKFEIIFHRFRQAEENLTRKFGGNGLGLAISKPLVKLMGGEIWLESEEKIGSTFYFTIDKIKKQKSTLQPVNFLNKNILLVEDDRHSVGYMRIVLEQFGATITHARTGYDALNILNKGAKFDLILMDIQLSDMSGLEVTRLIRDNDKDTPIIAQTAYAQQADRQVCLQAGCNDYIAKPIDDENLIALVAQYIKK
jgi:PAS domain S-box-containing protein